MKNSRLIVVLGMHRSGTSVMTRGLQVLGVNLGNTFLPSQKDNEKGFWEDIDLLSLNMEMLNTLGSDWYHLSPISPLDLEALHNKGYLLRAAELLRQKTSSTSTFGFKDPRVIKLLPFWKEVFSHCQFDVSYVLPVRHPLSVVKSLATRNGIEVEQGYLMWLAYVIASLTGSTGDKRVIVDYDRLIQSPDHELNRIAKSLDLEVSPVELQSYKTEFLDQRLRHTVYELNDLLLDDRCPPLVRENYIALLDIASDKEKVDSLELQNNVVRWSDEFVRLKSPLLLLDRLFTQKAVATQFIAERDGQIGNLNQAIAERDGQIGNLNQAIAERDGQIGNLKQAIAERDGQIIALYNSTCWRVTRPIRIIGHQMKRVKCIVERSLSAIRREDDLINMYEKLLKKIYSKLPLRSSRRESLKNFVFKYFPFMLKNTFSYKQSNLSGNSSYSLDQCESMPELKQRNSSLKIRPLISIVMPTYNSPEKHFRAAIASVISQVYENWELCICDDGSNEETNRLLREIANYDVRINVVNLDKNEGISKATNKALSVAKGEFIALLDHDDLLTVDALLEMVDLINTRPSVDVIYSDQDKVDENIKFSSPFYKPDWSPEFLLGVMYVGHLLVVRRDIALQAGGFNSKFDKVQDYEFMLRVAEITDKIEHVSKVLYHWRMIEGSLAFGENEKSDIDSLQVAAVNESFQRCGIRAVAATNGMYSHRVKCKPLPRTVNPKVSIIIPSKDSYTHIERCLLSIFEKTTYTNFEVIVVDNGTTDKRALKTLMTYPVKVIPYDEEFNFSKANNIGVESCNGEILILLNNDTEVITPDWIENLLYFLEKDKVGAVGPMLIYPDETVQHAGVVLGFRGTADHIMRGFPKDSDGYAGSLSCTREVSAVTGACLMMRKIDYNDLGGLVEYYAAHYQDVDLCLRIIDEGKRILYVSTVQLVHHESVSRKTYYDLVDRALLLDSWGKEIAGGGDRYYNKNFFLGHADYSLGVGQ
jgi:GT2 family glycosyltransferase